MKPNERCVAIVEDDELVGLATANLLRSVGLDVANFGSVEAFLGAQPGDYGCIISDVQMPGKSGLDLLEILKGQADAVPVIMMTAYPTDQVKRRALDGGAHCFLEKPYDPDTLIDCLAGLFGPLDD